MDPQFQLVFQFAASTKEEFEDFLELTDQVEEALAEEPDTFVDGHDFGLGEFNIFIHTDRPRDIFIRTADFLAAKRPGLPFSSGYRDFSTEDDYVSLWPKDSPSFNVL